MSFFALLKALRISANLSRPRTVLLLEQQGVRTSVATLERLESGNSRSTELVLSLLRLYHSREPLRPGVIETAFLCKAENLTLHERKTRLIATNLDRCTSLQLDKILAVMRETDSPSP